MTRTIVEFHALQSVPPSCLNRDDTNRPKSAIYGGTPRARVSSQAWKRAIRDEFRAALPQAVALRTKSAVAEVVNRLTTTDHPDAVAVSAAFLDTLGLGVKTATDPDAVPLTGALTLLAPAQYDALAGIVDRLLTNGAVAEAANSAASAARAYEDAVSAQEAANADVTRAEVVLNRAKADKKTAADKAAAAEVESAASVALATAKATQKTAKADVTAAKKAADAAAKAIGVAFKGASAEIAEGKAALKAGSSFDIALFGRMMAAMKDLNVDAAAQVAHAISVHTVVEESDFYTAVDDVKDLDDDADSGAGMLGTTSFNSSTLYRYATVDVDLLVRNLGDQDAAARALDLFASAFITSMPTGKQNTFANRTLPDAVVITVRDTQPINMVGAFEDAIAEGAGFRTRAAAALAAEMTATEAAYGQTPVARFVVATTPALQDAIAPVGTPTPLAQSLTDLSTTVRERLGL